MAQSSALREQPSMDEILASIRRIIDAGETQTQARAPEENDPADTAGTIPPAAANDAGDDRPAAPTAALPNAPLTRREEELRSPGEIAAAVDDYLEIERSKTGSTASGSAAAEVLPEPDISEVEAALRAEFSPVDRDVLSAERQAKYDARFTEADDGAFRQVGSLLRGKVGDALDKPKATESVSGALVSDVVSQSVSHSFSNLSDLLADKHGRDLEMVAEDMLRPMLQEWLDNNLPSLVERLVRGEIERIARGEPRTA